MVVLMPPIFFFSPWFGCLKPATHAYACLVAHCGGHHIHKLLVFDTPILVFVHLLHYLIEIDLLACCYCTRKYFPQFVHRDVARAVLFAGEQLLSKAVGD